MPGATTDRRASPDRLGGQPLLHPVNIFEAFSVARLLGLGITILDPGSDKEIAVSAASLYWDNGKI